MRTVSYAFGVLVGLILQLAVTHQRTNGEYCHGWKNAQSTLREGFHCPDLHDQREAVICCGTCELRYCCPLTKARLDQGNCYNHEHVLHPGTSNDEKTPSTNACLMRGTFLVFYFLTCKKNL
uniref:Shisa N-terminal domain-containing protein n=1 Tax=Esox lucius TaxID=8010 RepID=A0A6Q2WYT1_ESOLU